MTDNDDKKVNPFPRPGEYPEQAASVEDMAKKLAPVNAALPKSGSPFLREAAASDYGKKQNDEFRKHKAALRRAIIHAHTVLGPAPDWTELDDTVLDTVTHWLADLETRRKAAK